MTCMLESLHSHSWRQWKDPIRYNDAVPYNGREKANVKPSFFCLIRTSSLSLVSTEKGRIVKSAEDSIGLLCQSNELSFFVALLGLLLSSETREEKKESVLQEDGLTGQLC